MYTILFMPTYAARQLGLPGSVAFLASFLTGVIQVIFIPLVGSLSDRVGRLPIGTASAVGMLVLIYPMFAWLAASPTLQTLLIVQAVMGLLLAGYMGGLAALMADLFPTPHAYDGPLDQLFIWCGLVRRFCAFDQRVAHKRHWQQARPQLLFDAGGGHQSCRDARGVPVRD